MDTKKLRQKILDLAIHGKLVPQDPNDEPASVLLERIRAEKERLIKEGKIKRSRKTAKTSDTHHYEQDVPNGWCKTALSEIITLISGRDLQPTQYNSFEKGIPYITGASNIDNNTIIINRWTTAPVTISHKGDLLITCKGTIGKLAFNSVGDLHIARQLMSLQFIEPLVSKYLFYCLEERISAIKQMDNGLIPGIDRSIILNQIIQLPPLAEQYRIVAEIERWFALIDTIEESKEGLETAIKQTKSKILDIAIHGKLVPQDPNDEPASELLKRINPKAQIPCDNEHSRKLPPNWIFTKIKNVFKINPRTQADDDTDVAFVPMASISDGFRSLFTYDIRKWGGIKSGFTHFQNGDIAVAKISPCLENRKSVVFNSLPNGLGAGTTELHIFRPLGIDVFYALYFFKSNSFIKLCVGSFNGVVGQQRIGKAIIENISFPLPPLAEQKRIVRKIEDLFSLINIIEMELDE